MLQRAVSTTSLALRIAPSILEEQNPELNYTWQWGTKRHGKQSSHPYGISIVIRRHQKSAIFNNKS